MSYGKKNRIEALPGFSCPTLKRIALGKALKSMKSRMGFLTLYLKRHSSKTLVM
jgi:hypothetical protein